MPLQYGCILLPLGIHGLTNIIRFLPFCINCILFYFCRYSYIIIVYKDIKLLYAPQCNIHDEQLCYINAHKCFCIKYQYYQQCKIILNKINLILWMSELNNSIKSSLKHLICLL